MTIQRSVAARDAAANSFETAVGAAPLLRLYSGSVPATCATVSSGTLLGVGTLPSDWLVNASSNGTVTKNGTWTVTGQAGAGAGTTIGYYRIYDSTGTTCHEQGTCGQGTGDLSFDNLSIANTQTVTITGWTRIAGDA